MSCAPLAPAFWQRQPKLPFPVLKFMGTRLEQALRVPADRSLMVWPMVLGAPRMREAHPDGVPEPELLAGARSMLAAMGQDDPGAAWADAMRRLPNTAEREPAGWVAHRIWEPMAPLVSLRMGVALLAMLGQPEDERYALACGVALFNAALFHECHDALEPMWLRASGELKPALQGLILLAGGFHHMQLHNATGMISLWRDALAALGRLGGHLGTPFGTVDFAGALVAVEERMAWLDQYDGDMELDPLWAMARPTLELS